MRWSTGPQSKKMVELLTQALMLVREDMKEDIGRASEVLGVNSVTFLDFERGGIDLRHAYKRSTVPCDQREKSLTSSLPRIRNTVLKIWTLTDAPPCCCCLKPLLWLDGTMHWIKCRNCHRIRSLRFIIMSPFPTQLQY